MIYIVSFLIGITLLYFDIKQYKEDLKNGKFNGKTRKRKVSPRVF